MAERLHLHHRTIARLSVEYVAAFLCEGVAETGLDVLDYAIILVVSAGNMGRINGTPEALIHDHKSDAAVPSDLMTPTSLLTVEESLKLPEQTARERVLTLVDRGILIDVGGDRFIVGPPVTSSNTAGRLADKNAAIARRLVKNMIDLSANV